MRKTIKNFFICLFLCFLFFLFSLLNINYVNSKTIDYSNSDSEETNILYSEVIEWLTGYTTSENENKYFEYVNKTNVALKVNKLIPKTSLTFELSGNDLSVHAYSYSYTDKANNVHVWVPKTIYVGSLANNPTFNGTYYNSEFNDVPSNIDLINVAYECKLVISKDDCNELINLAYNDASYFVTNKVEETENSIYQEKLSQYNQYLIDLNKYNDDLVVYQNYLIEKENYDQAKQAYDEYLLELDEYNTLEQEYEAYLVAKDNYSINLALYQQYLSDLETYNQALNEYNTQLPDYTSKMELIQHQLLVVNTIDVGMIFGTGDDQEERSIKNAVLGDTVTNVLSQKADLAILNADQEAIDRAEVATINLREIFTQYFEKETDKDKYNFYCYRENFSFTNYKRLKTNMEELLRCLDKLYRSGRVEEALIVKGKKEKYLFLVAQLAYVCNALSDDNVYNYEGWVNGKGTLNRTGALIFDSSWTIDGRTINQILGSNVELILDNTIQAYPLTSGYPTELVEPTAPTVVTEPVMPAVVNQPIKPETVELTITEPTLVEMPVMPTMVEEPIPYVVDDNFRNVINDYNNSILTKRNEFIVDQEITIQSTLTKNFRNNDTVTIEFYDNNSNLLGTESTEKGSYIVFTSKPNKPGDEVNKEYVFKNWEYEDGTILDLNNIQKSGFVHPVYEEVKQEYIVTWIFDNKETKETYYYGDSPIYKSNLKKNAINNTYYVFKAWDKEISNVNNDITYTAIIEEKEIISSATTLSINNNECLIEINEINDLDISILIQEYSNINIFKISTVYYELVLDKRYDCVFIDETNQTLSLDKIKKINVNINNINAKEFKISVNASPINGSDNNKPLQCDITYYGSFDALHYGIKKIDTNNEEKDYEYTISKNKIKFTIQSNYSYYVYSKYIVNYTVNDYVKLNTLDSSYQANKIVTIIVNDLLEGKKVDSYYYINSKNEKVNLTSNTFEMPNDDIYIGCNISDIYCTVKFMDNDNVIDSKLYKYGDELVIPINPTKLSDEEHSYNFIGWMENETLVTLPEKVTDNHIYTASFEVVESSLGPLEQARGKIIPTIIISVILIISTPIVIVLIKKKSNKKKIR